MRNNPGFTLLAVLIMALGIGANTAVFSVVNTVLLKPLAYRDPDRIVTLHNFWKKSSSTSTYISAPDFHDWHDQSTAFDAMAYYTGGQTPVLSKQTAEYAEVTEVTSEFFDVMGVKPLIGRPFNDEERKPGSGGAVLISTAYWHSHFGGAPDAIGQTVRVFEKALPVVGVMPASFDFPQNTSIWYPADTIHRENTHRGSHNYYVIGRRGRWYSGRDRCGGVLRPGAPRDARRSAGRAAAGIAVFDGAIPFPNTCGLRNARLFIK